MIISPFFIGFTSMEFRIIHNNFALLNLSLNNKVTNNLKLKNYE